MSRIYLDYASLTPIDKDVVKVMNKYHSMEYMNPSSLYISGVASKKALLDARTRIAKILHAHPDEIIFTSGGTESNRLILESVENKNIIISAIEHSSIINNTHAVHISVDKSGIIDFKALEKSITAETKLVSIMLVNNEIGVIEPIHEIAKIIRHIRKINNSIYPLLHTDACQALYQPLHVEKLGVDLVTLDGMKMYGPRGVGMLYVRRGTVKIERQGTENIPGIMGFAQALEQVDKIRDKEVRRLRELKKYFMDGLVKINPDIKVNGNLDTSSPHILNVAIPNIDNEFFVLQLDAKGIECSTKSACLIDTDESYVMKAIGADSKKSVRFSFGRYTTKGELKKTLKIIAKVLSTTYN